MEYKIYVGLSVIKRRFSTLPIFRMRITLDKQHVFSYLLIKDFVLKSDENGFTDQYLQKLIALLEKEKFINKTLNYNTKVINGKKIHFASNTVLDQEITFFIIKEGKSWLISNQAPVLQNVLKDQLNTN